ncbi:hypothetical protein KC340_g18012 [Hortaea werneckii]|nr:hypothetical protein KC342_g17823 [Hortaea werneckii]KAI7057261.1 hypothetical protein KC339_g17973 [Hortaea werneckii]KAI7209388.1 hypothetical protein KC365_g15703 [Hortaea werneckii]KAI7288299.1 hypothetical protein KC340_g18012 [Hortaea werneckii]
MPYQQLTPSTICDVDYDSLQCPGGSASTVDSNFPQDWSPGTAMTAATTPPKSPCKVRELGPALLPRLRLQDQLLEPAEKAFYHGHSRTTSMPTTGFPMRSSRQNYERPGFERMSSSPPGQLHELNAAYSTAPFDCMVRDQTSSQRPTLGSSRSRSTSNVHAHSRNVSSSSIDASLLSRFGYPTYRQSPTPQPIPSSAPMSRTPSAMSHLAPITMPGGQMQSYPHRRRTASPPASNSRLSSEIQYDPELDEQTSNALEYLTAPNPTTSLTQRTLETNRGLNTHFWYDVRNVRAWSDFQIGTIAAVPQLLDVLRVPVLKRSLPVPSKVNSYPETPAHLAEIWSTHHAVKVNAVLRLTQGEKHIAMRTLKGSAGSRQQPEFVSSYQSDVEKTIYGDGRGRVVGVVKCYDQWNSGMRSGSVMEKIQYLQGLAHIHRFMREHETRYGFIMTEIELVCVRAGGRLNPSSNVPLFGYLEVAAPVQVATTGSEADGSPRMTADLALWWLHMLAKEQPLSGQYYWRIDVGGPAALSRKHHLPRDDWMPKCTVSEKREAKRIRGWVFPDEPLSKRECGRGKRSKT